MLLPRALVVGVLMLLLPLLVVMRLAAASTTVPGCAVDPWVRFAPSPAAASPGRDFSPYVARSPSREKKPFFAAPGSSALVFVHISKCAGTTFKHLLSTVAHDLRLDPPYTLFRRNWPAFLAACARGDGVCARSLYVGTNTLGACDHIHADRCLYATVLRDPVDRLVSSYRYFCLQGAEKRKGWQRGWDACAWTLQDWATLQPAQQVLDLSTKQAPVVEYRRRNQSVACPLLADGPARETVGARAEAHLAAALANVDVGTGAVRALILEDLAPGLDALARDLGLERYKGLFINGAADRTRKNANTEQHHLHHLDAATRQDLRAALHLDVTLYTAVRRAATQHYDALGLERDLARR